MNKHFLAGRLPFIKLSISFVLTFCLLRIYEVFVVAGKVFVDHPYQYEAAGIFYDVWAGLFVAAVLFIPYLMLSFLHIKVANIFLHLLHVIVIISYIALLITYSERTTPFDHELFTRKLNDSVETVRQMTTAGYKVYLPFLVFIPLYFVLYYGWIRKAKLSAKAVRMISVTGIIAALLVAFASPSRAWFDTSNGYYLTCNKMMYWMQDSYHFLANQPVAALNKDDPQLQEEITYYQQSQPFTFSSREYPLLRNNKVDDVLGPFFSLQATPPNIVLLVIEGLSSDFSGKHAYATSFTPFLDSLGEHSLTWDNFLSTAPGTFAAHPSIEGSLPYGKRGFSIMNVMPEHLSLTKIMKQNGYKANFMIGFNADFDNMGGFIRMQGTDFLLNAYPSKYREMGIGEEGWSMGYPDDALFERSLTVLDSMQQQRYLSIYHTGTTHMPYLFEQKLQYEKKFDQKIETLHASNAIKKTLRQTKHVLTTFMFSDDCLRKFFADYAKRPEYSNTIFVLTGDHHIGSFPTTGPIDEYHVPFIIYSPLLKRAQRFQSINSHLNIAPSLTNLLVANFQLQQPPTQVHWLGDVLDTAVTFQNKHAMPFMTWSREISDYIYKDFFLGGEQLYQMKPNLLLKAVVNDSIKTHMKKLRNNFMLINAYVCEHNKIFPGGNTLPGEKILLKEYADPADKLIFSQLSDTAIAPDFIIPNTIKYLYVEANGEALLQGKEIDLHPTIRFALIDPKNNGRDYLYWSKRDVATLSKNDFVMGAWNAISVNDLFALDDYKKVKDLVFETAIYTDEVPIKVKLKNWVVRIYGVK